MKVVGIDLKATSSKQKGFEASLAGTRKTGGRTAHVVLEQAGSYFAPSSSTSKVEFAKTSLSEGFVLDGYFLGTFEFDSLTGHPGIRY